MYCLKRSITYLDGSTDNIESVYSDFNELQSVLRAPLVDLRKGVIELIVDLKNVK